MVATLLHCNHFLLLLKHLFAIFRATWAVFPYTLLVLCWHGLILRATKIVQLIKDKKNMAVTQDAPKGYLLGATTALGGDLPLSRSTTADVEKSSSEALPSGM